NVSADHLSASDVFHTLDAAAAAVDIADNVAHVILRRSNLYLHDRLKKYRICFLHSLLECHGTCDMECHLTGVYLMVRSIVYGRVNAKHRESSQNTGLRCFLDTFADSRDV